MRKVLIFTETIGGNGHYGAAKSIKKALTELDASVHIKLINGLSLVNRKLENVIRRTYLQTLRHAPKLWGKAYAQEAKLSLVLQAPLGQLLALYLQEVISRENPDVVICTHAFCIGAIAKLKSVHHFRLGAAITDFDANRFWLHEDVDFYFVGHDKLRDKIQVEYKNAQVISTGIPIDPLFGEMGNLPKPLCRERIGIAEEQPTLLLMGGGMGLGPIEQLIEQLVAAFHDSLQIIVVTGRNSLLRQKCVTRYDHLPFVHIRGFVNEPAYYMAASDLIVTKPGGLTSSEALAMGLPIIISAPIPGHEERNTRFLLGQRVALRVDQQHEVSRYVRPFLEDPSFYRQFSARARNTGKPQSARHVAKVILAGMLD